MGSTRTRVLPRTGVVAREQISFVLGSVGRSWPGLIFFGMLIAWAATSGRYPAHSFAVFATLLASSIIVGAAWTRRPGPYGATYFLSLPGSRARNASLRSVGAWAVLMLTGVFLSVVMHRIGRPLPQPSWSYAAPLVGATVVILVLSGPMATLKTPIIAWFLPILLVPLVLSRTGADALSEPLMLLLEGRWGIVTLVSGQMMASGRLLWPETDLTPAQFVYDLPGWLIASAIWLAASVVFFAVTASRKVEA